VVARCEIMKTVTLMLLLEYVFTLLIIRQAQTFDPQSSIPSCIGYLTCDSNERAPVFSILHGMFAASLVLRKHCLKLFSTGMQYSS